MPTPPRSAAVRLLAAPALAVVLATILGACGLLPPGTVPEILAGPLVTFETRGGECPEGECGFTADIHADGRVVRSDGTEQTVDDATLARLTGLVRAADWQAILARPFSGECPRNFDGQEEVYTFHVAPEPVVVASCTTQVDHEQEPFRTVLGILFAVGG